jgi:hypothetical protein
VVVVSDEEDSHIDITKPRRGAHNLHKELLKPEAKLSVLAAQMQSSTLHLVSSFR